MHSSQALGVGNPAVVNSWLVNAGLKHHANKFEGVEPEVFRSLLMQDYAKYGVTSLEDKQKLFRLVKSLQMPAPADVQQLPRKPAAEEARPPQGNGGGLLDLEAEDEFHEEGTGLCTTSPEIVQKRVSEREKQAPVPYPAAVSRSANAHQPTAVAKAPDAKIKVCVRKRPLNKRERDRRDDDIMEVHSNQRSLTVHEPKQKVDLTKYTERHELHFDHVFDVNISNNEIYDTTIAPMLPVIYAGGRASCFAFGQTGSGKTYTMNPLPPRCANDLFDYVAGQENMDITVSVYEIYGSKIFDLLNARNSIVIREDGKKNVNVVGLQEKKVKGIEEVEQYLTHAASVRSTGCTGANSESSRSHCITNFTLRMAPVVKRGGFRSNRAPPPEFGKVVGKISFIDLAGSERGADTYDNNKQTRMEGAQINKSLLALKECIRALDQNSKHIPFRGSKLTEVLRESFTGHSVSVMIANISPSTSCCENSLNTLRYADRVKEMKRDRSSSSVMPVRESRQSVSKYHSNQEGRQSKQILSSSGQPNPNPIGMGSKADEAKKPPRSRRVSVGRPEWKHPEIQTESNKENCFDAEESGKKSSGTAEKVDYEEEIVIAAHKQLIEETMEFVRKEMKLLADVDQPGSSIEKYVSDLRQLLSKRANGISSFESKLASFETSLQNK
ncbi:kinesin-domain-containing protein [Chloropicon primus]|uniref:Kinesin-like protein n=2 Tax=Chloropicon primus TaxID=1764295 RepID=A0A5B8MDT7_9CHLO|nr:kinesin-domain-containing protein [Chloropicon primus]UPQ97021.1 kinesin-domain-containing protein [Chloropicon primus]|eukprot:QDZ17805.1 kinesin-domain-containing protein [Chloropicon primus]